MKKPLDRYFPSKGKYVYPFGQLPQFAKGQTGRFRLTILTNDTCSVDSMAICIVQMATSMLTIVASKPYGIGFVLQLVVTTITNDENFNSIM